MWIKAKTAFQTIVIILEVQVAQTSEQTKMALPNTRSLLDHRSAISHVLTFRPQEIKLSATCHGSGLYALTPCSKKFGTLRNWSP